MIAGWDLPSGSELIAPAFGVGAILADQWSKHVLKRSQTPRLRGRLRFVPHRHPAYQSQTGRLTLILIWLLALVSASVLAHMGLFFQLGISRAGLGLALGGAASNLLDMLRLRYVVDYIDLRWWPAFNLADVAIVVGLPVALLY